MYEDLALVFGVVDVQMLFHPKWQTREQGVKNCNELMLNGNLRTQDLEEVLVRAYQLANKGIADNVIQVQLVASKMLKDVLTREPFSQVHKINRDYLLQTFQKVAAHTVDLMLVFLGSANEVLRDIGHESLSLLMTNSLVGFEKVYDRFLEADRSKKLNIAKFITARLNFLHELVKGRVFKQKGLVDYSISHLRNANQAVRHAAYRLLLALYEVNGNAVMVPV